MKPPKTRISPLLVCAGLALLAAVLAFSVFGPGAWQPAAAAPVGQIPIFTPTPGPDGRIVYIVKANDTLLSISLLTGVPVEQLRALNNLSGDTIIEGQPLLLGLAGPPETTATPGPSPTPTPVIPTATVLPGSGTLCVLLFNDLNGDAIRQEDELSIPRGEISIGNRSGSVSLTGTTAPGADPVCFEAMDEGRYNVTVAIPEGYNPTTVSSYEAELMAGDETYLDFGAQANSETLAAAPAVVDEEGRSPLLGILGGIILVAGLALAVFAGRLLKG